MSVMAVYVTEEKYFLFFNIYFYLKGEREANTQTLVYPLLPVLTRAGQAEARTQGWPG